MRRFSTFALPFLLIGCAKPPEAAPEDLDTLSAFLFANFDSETGDELTDGLVNIEAYLDGLDLAGDINDRTTTLSPLLSENWGGISGNADFDGSAQVPRSVAGISAYGLEDQFTVALEPNHICIESETTKYASRTFTEGEDCFGDTCDRLGTASEIRKESILARVWFDVYKDYRLLTLEDGREVMIGRAWMEDAFAADGGNNSWDELYGLDVWIPNEAGDETKRFYAFWSSVTLGGIADDTYGNLVRDGIDEGYIFSDAFIGGTTDDVCNNDRDRAYDRE